jgi:translation elongation factor EF-Tu-like GTPase
MRCILPLRFDIRDCFTIVGRGTVVTGDTISGVPHVNDVVDLVHNGWIIRTKCIGVEMGRGHCSTHEPLRQPEPDSAWFGAIEVPVA